VAGFGVVTKVKQIAQGDSSKDSLYSHRVHTRLPIC
jgi:hypothetical protein